MAQPHHVVIVGGGAAGLPLATRLGDTLGRRGQATITLVDHSASHLWKPLLHEVAAGRVDADVHDVDYFLMAYWHHFRFRQGEVVGLDRKRRELRLGIVRDEDGMEILPERACRYDTLVFCVGSVNNDFGIPGVAERAISLDAAAGCRAVPSPPPRRMRARRRARGARRAGDRRDRDHRRGRDGRRARGGGPALHRRARKLRARVPEAGARHPADAHRGRAADPAAALGRDRGGRDRCSRKARRRSAHRRARHGDRCRRRAHGKRRRAEGRYRRLGGRHQGAGVARRSRRARSQSRASARRRHDARDHARSGHFRAGRLRRLPMAASGTRRRDPAAARAGRAAAGDAPREEHQGAPRGQAVADDSSSPISDRSCRSASSRRWAI